MLAFLWTSPLFAISIYYYLRVLSSALFWRPVYELSLLSLLLFFNIFLIAQVNPLTQPVAEELLPPLIGVWFKSLILKNSLIIDYSRGSILNYKHLDIEGSLILPFKSANCFLGLWEIAPVVSCFKEFRDLTVILPVATLPGVATNFVLIVTPKFTLSECDWGTNLTYLIFFGEALFISLDKF